MEEGDLISVQSLTLLQGHQQPGSLHTRQSIKMGVRRSKNAIAVEGNNLEAAFEDQVPCNFAISSYNLPSYTFHIGGREGEGGQYSRKYDTPLIATQNNIHVADVIFCYLSEGT